MGQKSELLFGCCLFVDRFYPGEAYQPNQYKSVHIELEKLRTTFHTEATYITQPSQPNNGRFEDASGRRWNYLPPFQPFQPFQPALSLDNIDRRHLIIVINGYGTVAREMLQSIQSLPDRMRLIWRASRNWMRAGGKSSTR